MSEIIQSFDYDVFVCYSKDDAKKVRRISDLMRKSGLRVWFDEWCIQPGQSVIHEIELGLQNSRVLVLMISKAALGSEWVTLERQAALFRMPTNPLRRFVPVLIDNCESDIPDLLKQFHHINLKRITQKAMNLLLQTCRPYDASLNPSLNASVTSQSSDHDYNYAVEKNAQQFEIGIDALEQILGDEKRLEWLLLVTQHYANTFSNVSSHLRNLASNAPVEYIVDFDVVYSYLMADQFESVEDRVTDLWFEYSDKPFRLPVGAFKELVRFLGKFAGVSSHLHQLVDAKSDRQDAIKSIAQSLGIYVDEFASESEIIARIASQIQRESRWLTRLHSLLASPRFLGVAVYEDNRLFELILSFIRQGFRDDFKERSLRDVRDAQNLAVALESAKLAHAQRKKRAKPKATHVLISRTSLVLDFARLIHDAPEELVSGIWKHIDDSIIVRRIFEQFPCMHPRDATNVDLLSLQKSFDAAIAEVRDQCSELQAIADFFNDILAGGSFAPEAAEPLSRLVRQNKGEVLSMLKRLSRQIANEKGGLRLLEDHRASTINTPKNGLNVELADLKKESVNFTKVLSEIESILTETFALKYKAVAMRNEPNLPILSVNVLESHSHSEESPLIRGEICLPPGDESRPFFSMRWPTFATAKDALSAIGEIVFSMLSLQLDVTGSVSSVQSTNPEWREGIIVSTLDTDYVIHCTRGTQTVAKHVDFAEKVLAVAKTLRSSRQLRGTSVPIPAQIVRLRVNTAIGDFMIDVDLLNNEIRRYFSVISHTNIADVIAKLYSRCGSRLVIEKQLSEEIFRLLQSHC